MPGDCGPVVKSCCLASVQFVMLPCSGSMVLTSSFEMLPCSAQVQGDNRLKLSLGIWASGSGAT